MILLAKNTLIVVNKKRTKIKLLAKNTLIVVNKKERIKRVAFYCLFCGDMYIMHSHV